MEKKTEERMPPVHPGEILLEEFMKPLELSQNRLARDTGMPQTRIQAIISGNRGISSDTAIRLAAYFGTTPEFWLHAQAGYELEAAERSGKRQMIEQRIRLKRSAGQCIL
ncbi:MAG: HigA family addiction module antitoxin [Desulfobulbus sp.]|jgi:addiction module HigA family antidote